MYQLHLNYEIEGTEENQRKLKDVLYKDLKNRPFYKVLYPSSPLRFISLYKSAADKIREEFNDFVIIGMGGATLNPQIPILLCQRATAKPAIHFMNNTDPYEFDSLLKKITLSKTAFLVISNSGETFETIALTKALINNETAPNFYFILGKNDSSLRRIANNFGSIIYDHESEISGRFSGLSNVSIFAGLVAGLDMRAFLEGANQVLEDLHKNKELSSPAKSAISIAEIKRPILVNLGYLQRFSSLLEWYCQIIAESLGKDGKGFTPIRGLGPNDQHSMLQLYLDGPQDKLFTLFYSKSLDYKSELSEANNMCFEACVSALKERNLPIRVMELDDFSEKSVGALLAHMMAEVILLGCLMNVNPFNQPGVELIKTHLR